MATTPPQLGYGQRTEAPINAVNVWMRGQPWYQQLLSSWGQSPNNVHLNDAQKQQVIRAAQANGVVVDEGHDGQQVDDSGNFEAKGHGLRNTLLVAGIAAASLATMGAAGVFSGAAGAAAGGGAALGPSTAANLAATAGVVGGGGVPAGIAAGAGGASTLGGLAGIGKFFASPTGAALAGTAANAFANIYGANKQADAAKYGVDAQTAAQKYAADLQDAAAQRAEAFTRQQAEGGWQSNEHTQHANYDQWRARQDAIMGSLGQQLGINYTPPQYSPGIDPHYTDASAPAPNGSAAPPSSASTTAPSGIDWTAPPDKLAADLSAFYKSKGVSDQEVPYWVSKAPELVARGKEINDPEYANKRLAASDVFGGGNAGNTAAPAAPQTLATFASPNFLRYQPTALPTTPYQPGTLGAYVGSY